jgi:hypothetical protein
MDGMGDTNLYHRYAARVARLTPDEVAAAENRCPMPERTGATSDDSWSTCPKRRAQLPDRGPRRDPLDRQRRRDSQSVRWWPSEDHRALTFVRWHSTPYSPTIGR